VFHEEKTMKSLKAEIYSAGQLVSSNVVSLDLIKNVNKIPYAQVVIGEGGEGNKSLVELVNETFIEPGREIEILLSSPAGRTVFKGIAVKYNLRNIGGRSYLTVDIKDKAYKLTLQRESAVFLNKNDAEIISELAKKAQVSVV